MQPPSLVPYISSICILPFVKGVNNVVEAAPILSYDFGLSWFEVIGVEENTN
jgi:hypothetical protein